jgi:hypothetical protein
MRLEFSQQSFEKKSSNIKFQQNLFRGSGDVSSGQADEQRRTEDGLMDRYDKANSRFSTFCERAYKFVPLRNSNITDPVNFSYWEDSIPHRPTPIGGEPNSLSVLRKYLFVTSEILSETKSYLRQIYSTGIHY